MKEIEQALLAAVERTKPKERSAESETGIKDSVMLPTVDEYEANLKREIGGGKATLCPAGIHDSDRINCECSG